EGQPASVEAEPVGGGGRMMTQSPWLAYAVRWLGAAPKAMCYRAVMRRRVSRLAAGILGLLTMGAQCLQPVDQCENHACDPPDSGCVSTSCQASGAQCGSVPDGCGQLLDCGSCSAPQSCGGSGIPNVCGCTPEPDDALCGSLHGCGDLTQTDACGRIRQLHCP